MKKHEILGLIVMTYDYKPNFDGISGQGCLIPIVAGVTSYLKHKGYFDKQEGRPTLKLYKLLKEYGIKIEQLKKYQDEYERTGHVTQYDKLGNKHVL